MPLGRFLKILLSGAIFVAVLFLARVEFLFTNPPSQYVNKSQQNQTYQQAFYKALEPLCSYIVAGFAWFGTLTDNELIALSTTVIAVFTVALVGVSVVQAHFIRKSIILARDEFNAVHRPRLRVRHIRIEPLRTDHPVSVRLEVVNVGETKANIILSDFALHVTRLNGETITYQMSLPIPDVHAGESLLIQQKIGPPWKGVWKLTQAMSGRISISGIIKYYGTMHPMETAFERVYDYKTRRFWPLKSPDPDHEHED